MPTTATKLHRLRERLAQEFEDILNSSELVLVDGKPLEIEGKYVTKRHSPAMYNTIRQFLKDNGIDREPIDVPVGPGVIEALPFAEPDALPAHLLQLTEHEDL